MARPLDMEDYVVSVHVRLQRAAHAFNAASD